MNQALVEDVVTEVMKRLGNGSASPRSTTASASPVGRQQPPASAPRPTVTVGQHGIFATIDEGVNAATDSQQRLIKLSLDERDQVVKLVKGIVADHARQWGELELAETGIGRADHKVEKLQALGGIPGVEFLRTAAYSGSNGVALDEFAPFGVIGCITPVTHSIPTLTCNAINMVASGNSLVINPHPSAANCAAVACREYNKAIAARWGIEHLVVCIIPPTLQTAEALFQHRGVPLIVVTGGAAVARAALAARKRAIIAGPGNPPVVVDETACLRRAAESIVKGGAYDNNLLCIGEKEVFCVDSVFDKLMTEMEKAGCFILNRAQIDALTRAAFHTDPKDRKQHVNKEFVGKDPGLLAQAAGVRIPPATQLLIGETNADHVFVQEEQMMPFIPIVRCRDVDEAIDKALQAEHGYRHTATIHSRNTETITRYGRLAATTVFVANGPSNAGLAGPGGQGYGSYTIATPSGEGITTPLTFTRFRRVMISNGAMRMV